MAAAIFLCVEAGAGIEPNPLMTVLQTAAFPFRQPALIKLLYACNCRAAAIMRRKTGAAYKGRPHRARVFSATSPKGSA
jgi:hypothetical protein